MIKPKSEKEVLEIQSMVRDEWDNALVGNPEYFDLEATVTDNGMFEYETPILKAHLYTDVDKPRPVGEKVTVRVSSIDIASWEQLLACMLITENEVRKNVVYVLLMSNNTVKIGRTKNFNQRKKTISTSSGLTIKKYWHTSMMEVKDASRIKNGAHNHFKKHRTKGEFFSIAYKDACAYVNKLSSCEGNNHAETD
jgi:hypothetical protein